MEDAKFIDKVNVTPVGILANVKRIRVLLNGGLGNATPLFDSCNKFRKAVAKPSVIVNEACPSGTVLFVKIVAVPRLG